MYSFSLFINGFCHQMAEIQIHLYVCKQSSSLQNWMYWLLPLLYGELNNKFWLTAGDLWSTAPWAIDVLLTLTKQGVHVVLVESFSATAQQ